MSEARYGIRNFVRAWFCVAAVSLFSVAHGQSIVGDGSLGPYPARVSGNSVMFERLLASPANIDRFALGTAVSGSIDTSAGTRLANGTAVTVSGTISKASAAAAIGRVVARASWPIGVVTTGMWLYDLATDVGYTASAGGGHASFAEPYGVYSSTVSGYGPTQTYTGSLSSISASINAHIQNQLRVGSGYSSCVLTPTAPALFSGGPGYSFGATDVNCGGNSYSQHAFPTGATGSLTKTHQEFVDAIAAKSGWPSSAALARATKEAVKYGESVQVEPLTVSGPSSSPGPVRTSTAPDGKVTTATTTNNYTYNTNSVTTSQTTVTNVYNPSTGGTDTTTDEAPAEEPQKDQCAERPNSAGCAELDTPQQEIPRTTHTITYAAETPFGEGACPATVSTFVTTLQTTVTPWDWSKVCTMVLPFRAMVILLATISAFFIVMPVRVNP